MNSDEIKRRYIERLTKKGIHCHQHVSCSGCFALTALKRERVVGDNGMARKDLSMEELRHYGLFGECDLGFEQKWQTWDKSIPIEPCPKPMSDEDLLQCIMQYG